LFLAGAGLSALAPELPAIDLVLIQLVFYGAWAAMLGSWGGGLLGAAVEEDACGELDMGVSSSMGALLGAVAASLAAEAVVGLALEGHWAWVWGGAVLASLAAAGLEAMGVSVVRRPGFDARGQRVQDEGRALPTQTDPWPMRDRFTLLVLAAVLAMVGLTGLMAWAMGSGFGSPLMLAPMAYGMSGGMLGGILGGWISGLRDEHKGPAEHENTVMVAAMALMSGMMGAMPAAMVGGMMAVMGPTCLWATVFAGAVLALALPLVLLHGRYRLRLGNPALQRPVRGVRADGRIEVSLPVSGMSCVACVGRVRDGLLTVPGVEQAEVDLGTGSARLVCEPGFDSLEAIAHTLEDLGYPLARDRDEA
jgi:copper chaperone CopZ